MTTTNLSNESLSAIIAAADEVLTALAGTNDDVHPEDSTNMCGLWDDLNDRYAPPAVVKAMARELLALREAAEKPVATMHRLVNKRNGDEHPWVCSVGVRHSSEGDIFRVEVQHLYAAPQLPAEPVSQSYKLPMQPLVVDSRGALRFKENTIVRKLLDFGTAHGYGLNQMALEDFSAEDRMQFAQLIGYSLSGYGTLSYVTDESYDCAIATAPQLPGNAESKQN